ncbi:MAG: acyltransferase, partial [Bacteroidales bacterium]|nr:acyltransferase [Bacteroidales bacterium]
MIDLSEFEDIRPYSDEEAVEALQRVSRHPSLPMISKYLFPKEGLDFLGGTLRRIKSIDEFQAVVMTGVITAVLARTSEGFTYSGMSNLTKIKGKFLAISNHRDIVLDPALILYSMHEAGLPFAELCVGSNLLSNKLMEDLMKSNRMIKVIRGISARQMYLNSQTLSKYIRLSITSGNASIWVAQKEGRSKNGIDKTEQGLLKMFDMSGENGFEQNFEELNIVPMSISYEYEPCDSRKARELLLSREAPYVKKPKEDLHSILTGIRQQKGHIHLNIGKPLTAAEIHSASEHTGNDRYQLLRDLLDQRIHKGYKLWKTNYMGYDLMNGTSEYLGVKY